MVIFTPLRQLVNSYRFVFVFLLLFLTKNTFGQVGGITSIYTDYNGYWNSSSAVVNPIKPDNDHNVLGFTWNNTNYSTGVNDAMLTANGITFIPVAFQAFPVRNINLSNPSRIILGQLKDGVDNGASNPLPFTPPPQISNFLTDGIQGLNIGTGVIDVPSGSPLTFDFGAIISVSQINDGVPDLLISQVGIPVSSSDRVYFINSSGVMVGNAVTINQTTYNAVGNWSADLYDTNGTLPTNYTKTDRPIRIWAADVAAFGINSSNFLQATALKYELSGNSDPAFLAYNTSIIQIFSANDDAATTNMGTDVAINVLDNDVPSSAIDASSVTITTQPVHGTAVVSSTGVVTYTPATGYFGTDNFVYKVFNIGSSQSDIAQVAVTVGGPVTTPVFDAGLVSSLCMGSGQNYYTATATNSTGITYDLSPVAAGTIDASSGLVTWSAIFSGTATITATASGQGGPHSATYSVTVNPTPTVTSASSAAVCNQTPQNYTITSDVNGATFSWSRQAVAGISNAAVTGQTSNPITETLINTTSAPVDVIYIITPQANSCTGTAFNYTVSVEPTPDAPTAVGTSICSGNTTTLTASGSSGTYEWFDTATGGNLLSSNASFTTGFLTGTTTFYVQTTVNSCTSARTAVTVTVNPIPAAPTANGTTICSGNMATLTATAPGGTYDWYSASSGGTSLFTGASFTTPNLLNTTTFYVEVTSAQGCTSARTAATVTVNPIPSTPVVSSNSPVCAGTNLTLNTPAVTGASYSWTGPDNFASNQQNPIIAHATAAAQGTYALTITVNGCTSNAGTTNVIINPIPATPLAGGNSPVCAGETLNLTSNNISGATYSWSGPNGFTSTVQNPVINNAQVAASGTYAVQVTINGCISAAGTINITVNPVPPAPILSSNGPVCATNSLNLMATSVAGANYSWTGPNGFTSNLQNPVIPSATVANSGTYDATISLNGCSGPATSITVTVYPKPVLSNTSFNQVICSEGSSVPVQLTSDVSGTNFTWTATATQSITGYTASGTTDLIPAQTIINSGSATGTVTYTIKTFYNGCEGTTGSYTINVNPKPAVTSAASGIICSETPQHYLITGDVTGTTFSWSRAVVTGISNPVANNQMSNMITEALVNTTSAPINVAYTVVPEANNCTGADFTYTILVNPTPNISSAASATICNQTPQNYTITSNVSGATFSWNRESVAGISNAAVTAQTSNSITETLVNTSSAPVSVTYHIVAQANGCTGQPFNYTVIVNPTAVLSNTALNQTVCSEASSAPVTLTSTVTGANFTWTGTASPGITGFTTNGTSSIPAQTLINTDLTAGSVTYTIKSFYNGCEGVTSTYTITVNPKPAVVSSVSDVICNETPQNYTINSNINGATFSWSRATVAGISNAAVGNQNSGTITETLINTTSAPNAVAYTIVPEANGCTGERFTYTVTVKPTPTVTSAASGSICNNVAQNYSITSNVSGATFGWSRAVVAGISNAAISNQNGNTITETLLNTTSAPVAVSYSITPEANGCSGVVFTYIITVNPTPAVNSATTAVICNESAQNYHITSNVSNASFSWSRGAVTGISNAVVAGQTSDFITETLVNTTFSPVAVTYFITPQANGCAGSLFTYAVTVNPTPIITSAASAVICNETSQNYSITSNVSNASFGWSRAAVTGISNAQVSGQTGNSIRESLKNTTSAPVTATYIITPEANDCFGTSFQYQVTVNPSAVITSAASGNICSQTPQNYNITSNVNSATFSWSRAAVTGISNAAVTAQTGKSITETLENTTSNPVAVVYTIVPEANGCTGTSFTYTLMVNPTPIVNSAPNATICNQTPQNYSITGNVKGATFSWSRAAITGISNAAVNNQTGNTISETLINITSAPISVPYVIFSEANSCSGTAFTYTILVNPTPALSNTSFSQVICSEGSSVQVQLTSNVSGTNFSWMATASAGITGFIASGTSLIPAQTLVNSGSLAGSVTYTIKPFFNGCEGITSTYIITVNPKPAKPVASSNSPVCSGTNLMLKTHAVAGAVYTWTGPNGFTSNQQNPEIANVTSTAQGTYFLIVTVNGCSSDAGAATVTVNPVPPAPLVSSNGILCEGETLRLTASNITGATYNWSGPNGFTSSVQNPVIDRVSVAASGNYTSSVTVNGCTSTAATIAVLVNPIPAAPTAGSNSPVCATTDLNLSATTIAGASYQWTGPNKFSSTQQNPIITAATPANSGTYAVTVAVRGCESLPSFIKVLVNPLPAEAVLSSNSPVCSDSRIELICSTIINATYRWTGPNGFTSTQQNPIIDNAVIANQGRYTVVVTTPGCTVSNTSFIDVKVNPTPNAPVASNNGTLCVGQTLKLSATTIVGADYGWTGPNGFKSNQQNPEITNVRVENAGKYLVTATLNGCTSDAAATTIIINKPTVVVAGNDQLICAANPTITLPGSISGGSITGIWSTTGSGSFPAGNSSLKGTYLPSAADIATGNITLTLTAANTAPCAVASSFNITFTPTPVVFAGEDQAICLEDLVTLNGKITNGSSGVWSSSGSGTFNQNNSLTTVYHPSEKDKDKRSIILTLTATGNGSCAIISDQVSISLIPAPKVSAGNDIYVMEGEKITLQPLAIGTDLKYNWLPNLYLDNSTLKNPVLTGTQDIVYTLTVTGTAGCEAQDQIVVKVLKPVVIPNTFTPNADGINDTWGIKELINYPDVTVKIFNRYGVQLFYSLGYSAPWDGTFNGQPLPVGTYYYIIDLKTYGKLCSGPVTILR